MKAIFTVLLSLSITPLFSQLTDTIDYFGQIPPGNSPEIFAPGIISVPEKGSYSDYLTFSPDGQQMFYIDDNTLKYSQKNNGDWVPISDSVRSEAHSPVFATFDSLIYWYVEDNLYYSMNNDTGWSDLIATNLSEATFVSSTSDSTLFYKYHGNNINEIYYSKFNGTIHETPKSLPYPINNNYPRFIPNDPCISPDGTYLLLNNDSGTMGSGFYISFKKNDAHWTNPVRLSGYFPNLYFGLQPRISPDGKYLFSIGSPDGNELDIYWVNTEFVEEIRNSNFLPYKTGMIPDFTDSVGNTFNYTIPDTLFIDDDGNETLTISVKMNNGAPLPGWLDYYPETKTISGDLTETGTFNIRVSATDTANATVSDIFKLTVLGPTSIQNTLFTKLKIYPNPTDDILLFHNRDLFNTITYGIYSLTGQLLQAGVLTGNSIDLTGYRKGLYLLRLNTEDQTYIERILIE